MLYDTVRMDSSDCLSKRRKWVQKIMIPKLSDSFEKNLIVQRRCYRTQSPNKCHSRLSGIILKTKKDSEQVGMTKYRIAQLRC